MTPNDILNALKALVIQFDGLKKLSAMLAGVIVAFALRYGINLDAGSVAAVVSPILAYLIGQGIADANKPKPTVKQPNPQTSDLTITSTKP